MSLQHPLHTHAQRLAKRLAKGQAPQLGEDLRFLLQDNPAWVMDSLKGLLEAREQPGAEGDWLVEAYSILLGQQLEFLRYGIDRSFQSSIDLAHQFQHRVVGLARNGVLAPVLLSRLAVLLRDAKLQPIPELFEAVSDLLNESAPAEDFDPQAFQALLADLAKDVGDDPFEAARAITEITYAMPAEALAMLADIILSDPRSGLGETVPLMLLDDRREARQGLARVLLQHARALSPIAMRRLIALRNWLPENERPPLDETVKAARRQGVVCASWPDAREVETHASAVDGSGAQGFILLSKEKRKHTFSSILIRHGKGILDAWSQAGLSKRERDSMMDQMENEMPILRISRDYLDHAVQHQLAAVDGESVLPPIGLLQVAETIGASTWLPQRLELDEGINRLLRELPPQWLEPAAIDQVLTHSAAWAERSGITESWFEDDQAVLDVLAATRSSSRTALASKVLAQFIQPRSLKWAERCLWTALWCREGPRELRVFWPNFLLVAKALRDNHPLKSISLMSAIAELSVEVALENR